VAAMLRVTDRGETRLARPRGFGVATGVAGPLWILPTRAEACPAWVPGNVAVLRKKPGAGERERGSRP
jgi:hypothetical protein